MDKNLIAYKNAEPKMTGNLHERMKFVLEKYHMVYAFINKKALTEDQSEILHKLHTGLLDLETEVKYTKPAQPPYGQRAN